MGAYYLDTSALVKRYAAERGTAWVVALTDRASGHDLYTARVTGPEMIAALFQKVRTGESSLAAATRASHDFRIDWEQQYQIVEIVEAIAEQAMNCAERYGLRGYDAMHLAAAVELGNLRRIMQLPPLTFVSADEDQLQAAVAEGLAVENPNLQP